MPDMRHDLVLLGVPCAITSIVYNHLCHRFGAFPVALEAPMPRTRLLKIRAHRIGWPATLSQAVFALTLGRAVGWLSRRRLREIEAGQALDTTPIPRERVTPLPTVNDPACVDFLTRHRPRVVVVNGTRLIKPPVLDAVDAFFLNTHLGITPRYRGAHGGYWALYNDDPAHCGVTVHRVDAGIDTGGIVEQATIAPGPRDTFATYPHLQIAAARPLLDRAVDAALAGDCPGHAGEGPSGLWRHPTVGQYVTGLLRGVK